MKAIWQAYLIHIDITNACFLNCAYCTRFKRHIRPDQLFFMDLDTFRKAMISLKGWPNGLGIIGGEPLLHPQFEEICRIMVNEFKWPKLKLAIWTSGGKNYLKYKKLLHQTFGAVSLIEHNKIQLKYQKHQPLTIGIDEIVENKSYMRKLIDNCWVQNAWCPTIGPKGCFFCEIAHGLDIILDGPGGYPIEPGWWKKDVPQFQDQIKRFCLNCGAALPIKGEFLTTKREKVTPRNLKLFKKHKLPNLSFEDITIFDKKMSIEEIEKNKKGWDPQKMIFKNKSTAILYPYFNS